MRENCYANTFKLEEEVEGKRQPTARVAGRKWDVIQLSRILGNFIVIS